MALRWTFRIGKFLHGKTSSLSHAIFLLKMVHSQQRSRECCTCRFYDPNYGAALVKRLRRMIVPERALAVDCNVVPHDAPTIALTHRTRNQSTFVPELDDARIGNPLQCRR